MVEEAALHPSSLSQALRLTLISADPIRTTQASRSAPLQLRRNRLTRSQGTLRENRDLKT